MDTPAPRFLCILAVPRTGSSYLNALLRSMPEMNAKSELFHSKAQVNFGPRELAALAKRSGIDLDDKPAFTAWRRANPLATVEAIRDGAWQTRTVAFKVFPGHLKQGLLEEELMARDDVAFAILRRRAIDSFISGSKAKNAGTFTQIDTTQIKPTISAKSFIEWARRTRRWYRWCERTLKARDKPFARIQYELHLDRQSSVEAAREVVALLKPLGFDGIALPATVNEGRKQDTERRYQDRVANWDAFETEVRALPNGAKFLDWAERAG